MQLSVQDAHNMIMEQKTKELALGELPSQKVYDYSKHIYGAAYIARIMALKIPEINPDTVYVSTLLHDIGRLDECRTHRFHGIIGYEKLKDKDENAAKTALIHMFPYNKLPAFELCADLFFDNRQDYNFVSDYLKQNAQVTEEDLLIQLADCLANKNGFVTLPQRFAEYQKRHQVILPPELTIPRYQLKTHFDKILGIDVYSLFPDSMDTKLLHAASNELQNCL